MNAFSSGGGDDNRTNACLLAIEESLTRLETRMEYVATKQDVENMKIWMLGGASVSVITTVGLVTVLTKLFYFSG